MDCRQHIVKITDGLRQKKLKVTPARLQILDIFEHAAAPLDAGQVALALRQSGMNQSTIYRNLEALAELGFLKRLRLRSRQAYYELADDFSGRRHHHHLVCTVCGKIKEVVDCRVSLPGSAILERSGFKKISDHSLEFFGLCLNCFKGGAADKSSFRK